jgi:putative endonuclease
LSYWVYILYSESINLYYKGQTRDLENRLFRHNNGYEKSTKKGIPWRLVWRTELENRSAAMMLEKKLKNLSHYKLQEFIKKYNGDNGRGS